MSRRFYERSPIKVTGKAHMHAPIAWILDRSRPQMDDAGQPITIFKGAIPVRMANEIEFYADHNGAQYRATLKGNRRVWQEGDRLYTFEQEPQAGNRVLIVFTSRKA